MLSSLCPRQPHGNDTLATPFSERTEAWRGQTVSSGRLPPCGSAPVSADRCRLTKRALWALSGSLDPLGASGRRTAPGATNALCKRLWTRRPISTQKSPAAPPRPPSRTSVCTAVSPTSRRGAPSQRGGNHFTARNLPFRAECFTGLGKHETN